MNRFLVIFAVVFLCVAAKTVVADEVAVGQQSTNTTQSTTADSDTDTNADSDIETCGWFDKLRGKCE